MKKNVRKIALAAVAVALSAAIIAAVSASAVRYKRNADAERRFEKIASLQEPEFKPEFLARNKGKADFQALHKLLKQKQSVTWLFAGDSITHGCMHTGYHANSSELFEKYIKTSPYLRRNDIIVNTAASSATTADLNERFDDWISQPDADAVFLCFGTNDCTAEGMTKEIFKNNLVNAVKKMRKSGAVPILQTPNVNSRQEPLKPYIEVIRAVAEEESVLLIDVNKLFENNSESVPYMLNDGLHPNAAGHVVWCRFMLKSLGMYSPESELAKLKFGDVARDFSAADEQPKIKAEVKGLEKYLNNEKQAVWVFAGGKTTEGLELPVYARTYVSHFNEVVRWENAMDDMNLRCKTIVNSGRKGYLPTDILKNYDELIGKFNPDVVVYLPEITDGNGKTVSDKDIAENGEFFNSLMKLSEKVHNGGAKLVILSNPAVKNETTAGLLKNISSAAGDFFIDTADMLKGMPWDGSSAESQFALGRAFTLSCCEVAENSRMK